MALAQAADQQELEFRFVGMPLPGIKEADSSAAPPSASLRSALAEAGFLRGEDEAPEESWLLLDGALRSIASGAAARVIGENTSRCSLDELIKIGRAHV